MRVKTQVQQSPLRRRTSDPDLWHCHHRGILRKRPSVVAGVTSCHDRAITPASTLFLPVRPTRGRRFTREQLLAVFDIRSAGAHPHTLTTGVDSASSDAGMPAIGANWRYLLHGVRPHVAAGPELEIQPHRVGDPMIAATPLRFTNDTMTSPLVQA